MILVVSGWVYVGTQTSAGSIKAAKNTITIPILSHETNVSGECIGIRDRTTFDESYTQRRNPLGKCRRCSKKKFRGQRESSLHQDIEMTGDWRDIQPIAKKYASLDELSRRLLEHEQQCSCSLYTFLGFPIAGCDLEPGPIFNYARIWSHMNAVQHVANAFRAVTRWQKKERSVHGQTWDSTPDRYDENFRGSPQELFKYISELGEDNPDFSVHGKSSSGLVLNCIIAAFVAIFL